MVLEVRNVLLKECLCQLPLAASGILLGSGFALEPGPGRSVGTLLPVPRRGHGWLWSRPRPSATPAHPADSPAGAVPPHPGAAAAPARAGSLCSVWNNSQLQGTVTCPGPPLATPGAPCSSSRCPGGCAGDFGTAGVMHVPAPAVCAVVWLPGSPALGPAPRLSPGAPSSGDRAIKSDGSGDKEQRAGPRPERKRKAACSGPELQTNAHEPALQRAGLRPPALSASLGILWLVRAIPP